MFYPDDKDPYHTDSLEEPTRGLFESKYWNPFRYYGPHTFGIRDISGSIVVFGIGDRVCGMGFSNYAYRLNRRVDATI